jgi:hypothetical protein
MTGYGWIGGEDSDPAEFSMSPVLTNPLYLADWGEVNSRDVRPYVCPGTPLRFSMLQASQRSRLELDVHGVRLTDYQLEPLGGGFAIGWHIGRRLLRPGP